MFFLTFSLYTYFFTRSIFLGFNLLILAFIIFMEKKNYASTWAWIMIILFFPILGFILYLYIGLDMRKKKKFSKKEEEDTYLHLLNHQAYSLKITKEEFHNPFLKPYESTIKLNLLGHEALFTCNNQLTLFTDGYAKFDDLFKSIEDAKETIHLEYYIIRDDFLGNTFRNLLVKKAKEGVKVKLLYDGMGCLFLKQKFFKPLLEAGGKVCCFFPPFIPYIHLRFNYRNHRKLAIIDGKVGYIGGFNIGKEYLGLEKKMGYWRDTHLKIIGDAVQFLELQFLLDWRFATKENNSLRHRLYQCHEIPCGDAGVQIVASGPDSIQPAIRNSYVKMINEAKESIFIQTPYFIPDEALLAALKIACLAGIDVRIMIPNKPDHMFVYWATYSYIGDILACGGKCYTYENGFLHAKTLMIDGKICSIGTSNFDMRSFKLNFEVNAFIYHEPTTAKLVQSFMDDLKYSKKLDLATYQNRSIKIRIKESVSRLLSPIL